MQWADRSNKFASRAELPLFQFVKSLKLNNWRQEVNTAAHTYVQKRAINQYVPGEGWRRHLNGISYRMNIKFMPKGSFNWIVGFEEKKIILAEALPDVGVSLSVYRPGGTETPVCCCSVLPGFGNLSETLWEMHCSLGHLFVSLWYADKPDIKRGSHGDEKEPADTVQRWGRERRTINGIQACLDIYWLDCMRPSLQCTRN